MFAEIPRTPVMFLSVPKTPQTFLMTHENELLEYLILRTLASKAREVRVVCIIRARTAVCILQLVCHIHTVLFNCYAHHIMHTAVPYYSSTS